jgi:hypothetical protein
MPVSQSIKARGEVRRRACGGRRGAAAHGHGDGRLGLEQAADQIVTVGYRPGRKLSTLVHTLVAGGECNDVDPRLGCGGRAGRQAMFIDLDSTICEVHGYAKQGAGYGYTGQLGYHPLLATRAATGEVLHARMRKGSANTARGAQRFVRETIGRVRRAGATGTLTFRADSGFWSAKVIKAVADHNAQFSITVR